MISVSDEHCYRLTVAKRYATVYVPTTSVAALNLSSLIHRYVRPFTKHDAQHALQYVACICLSADQGNGVGKEQVEYAWTEVRKIIVLAEGAGWDELVGGLRPDGTRFVSNACVHHDINYLTSR